MDHHQLDVLDCLDDVMAEAEREGKRLSDRLCDDCPDPGLCAAEANCPRGAL